MTKSLRLILSFWGFILMFIFYGLNPVLAQEVNGGKIFVNFKDKPKATAMLSVISDVQGSSLIGGIPNTDTVVVNIRGDVSKAIEKVKANKSVRSAAVVPKVHTFKTTNDTLFSQQWALQVAKIDQAWEKVANLDNTNNIKVAILDSGVQKDHPDLSPRIDPADWVTCDADGCVTDPIGLDPLGHGTHLAGIVGAVINNNQGIAGAGWGTKLMSVQVLDDTGGGDLDVVMKGVAWAADHNAKIINMSFGVLTESLTPDIINNMIQPVINAAWNKGAILVAAAGNCGKTNNLNNGECFIPETNKYVSNSRSYPGASDHVISVAAVKSDRTLAAYSEHNDPAKADIGNWISVAAPGGEGNNGILSTFPGNNYVRISGTSMASPYVAGIAALVWAANPGLTNTQVKQILESSADESAVSGATNHGLIDALAAVNLANAGDFSVPTITSGPTVTVAPSVTGGITVTVSPSTTAIPPTATSVPSTLPTPSVTPWPLVSPRLLKTTPDPYPTGPYCPNI